MRAVRAAVGHAPGLPADPTVTLPNALPRGYLPADLIVLAYLVLTGVLLIVSPLSFPGKGVYAAAHFLALVAIGSLRFFPRDGHRVLRFVRYTYPLFALPVLYSAVQYLNRLATSSYFDAPIVALEQAIFGCQPSQALHGALPWLGLSEFLHLAYLAYALLIPVVTFPLYFARRDEELKLFATSVMLTFLFCYTVFTFFPVRGPFYYFGPIDPAGKGIFFPQIVHQVLTGAASVGTAFPSSHVAASVCIWMVSRRFFRRLSIVILVVTSGILVGTVYGGFHYAIDALVGLVVGIAGGIFGPRVHAEILRLQGVRQRA